MNVSEYRLYISTNDIQYDNPYECSLLPDGETENKSNYDLYIAGYRIAFSEMTGYQWAKKECTDVRSLGSEQTAHLFAQFHLVLIILELSF